MARRIADVESGLVVARAELRAIVQAIQHELPVGLHREQRGVESVARDRGECLAHVREAHAPSGAALAEPPEEVWDDYWRAEGYRRVERGAAWVLITLAALILVGFGLWHAVGALLRDSAVSGFVKIAVFALLMGGAVMLASVIREKLAVRRRDPYLKVKR